MAQTQEQAQQIVTMSINDLIYGQLKELGKRMDRLEHRQDRLEEKLEITRQELNKRMDKQDEKIESKIDSSSNHGQIANITTVGIALAVIYSLLK